MRATVKHPSLEVWQICNKHINNITVPGFPLSYFQKIQGLSNYTEKLDKELVPSMFCSTTTITTTTAKKKYATD